MKINSESNLESTIESALALLDLKGTNIEISHAMSIVRIAFAHAAKGDRISPSSLYEKARMIHEAERDDL